MLWRLLGAMDRGRFQPVVVSLTGGGGLAPEFERIGVPVYDVGMSRGVADLAGPWRLWRLLRRERPDVLQTWLYHADLIGLVVGVLARVPAVAWNIRCSRLDERYRRGVNGAVVRALALLSRFPDLVLFNSHAGLIEHQAIGYRPRHHEIMLNGFDTEVFRPRSGARAALLQELALPADRQIVGLVARYDPLKDHATFLRAASLLARQEPDVHFAMIGEGVEPGNAPLMRLVAELGLTGRVHMMGPRDDIAGLTAGFDLAVCSSSGEGFPNVVAEAMACGIPCASTDIGDAARLVSDTGRVVLPEDEHALAAALADLVRLGPDGRQALGARARERIIAHYSLATTASHYQEIYASLGGERETSVAAERIRRAPGP